MEDFEIKGYWWVPKKPDDKIAGVLRHTSKKITLELLGLFKEPQEKWTFYNEDIILGFSENGKEVTLHGCFDNGVVDNIPGFVTSSYCIHELFVGVHFNKLEDIKFKNISVQYLHLDNWLGISGFQPGLPDQNGITIKFIPPAQIKASINDNYNIIIGFHSSYQINHDGPRKVTLDQTANIIVESKIGNTFEDFLQILFHLRNFLSLGVMAPEYPLLIKGQSELKKIQAQNQVIYEDITIYYILVNAPDTLKTIHDMHMLFTYREISDNFELYIKNWFNKKETLEPVFNLYFATLYDPQMYLNHKFLSLIHAIETYHRRTMKNYVLPKEQYESRTKEIINSVPQQYKGWLCWKLNYGNEPDLRSRLKELLEKFSFTLNESQGYNSKFIEDVVNTRNYHTHFDEKLKDKVVQSNDMFKLTQKMRVMLEIFLLTELGFTEEKITTLIRRSMQNKGIL